MGFFSGLIKGIGNAVTAPIKAAGKIVTGKGNLGDAFNLASLFAPGGNILTGGLKSLGTAQLGKNLGTKGLLNMAGFGDPSKWTAADIPNILGAIQSMQGGSNGGSAGTTGTAGGQSPVGGYQQLLDGILPTSLKELQNYATLAPQRSEYLKRAAQQYDPVQQQAMAHQLGNRARASNLSRVNQTASAIGNNGAIPGLTLDAMNRGTDLENNALAQMYDPAFLAKGYMDSANALSPDNQLGSLGITSNLMNAIQQAMAQNKTLENQAGYLGIAHDQNRPATFWEQLIQSQGGIENLLGMINKKPATSPASAGSKLNLGSPSWTLPDRNAQVRDAASKINWRVAF